MDRAFAVSSMNVAPQVVMAPSSLRAPMPQKASATNGSFHMASSAAVSACALALATGGRASVGKRRLARGQALCRSAVGTIATGQRVQWNGVAGVVQFVGKVGFAAGEWIGVQLDEPKGMHDGSVFNESYFSCQPKHGVFCQPKDLGLGGGAPAVAAPAAAAMPAAASPAPAMGATSGAAAVGQKVSWKGNPGTVRFVGKVAFATEEMAGIELDGPQGMHDGSLFGTSYFSCPDKHGVFCKLSELGGGSAPTPAAPAPVFTSSPASAPMAAAASPGASYAVGQKVSWKGNPGTVQFVGKVAFAADPMIGVQLDAPNGMHNGSLFGETYFSCPDKHGVFCQASDLQ